MKVKSSNLKGKTPGEEEVEHIEGSGKMRGEEDMSTPISGKNFGEIYRATAHKQPKKSSNLKGKMPGEEQEEEVEQIEGSGKMPGEL